MSTLTERTGRFGAGALAIVTSMLVVLSGFLVVPAAQAAEGPTITVSPAENLDPAVEQTLTVAGTGFVGDAATTKNGVYVLFGEKSVWSGGGPLVSNGWITQGWVQARNIVDGAFTTTVKVPANTLDPAKEYHVATSAAHELSGTVRALDAFASVTVQQPVPAAVPTATSLVASATAVTAGDEVTFTATVAPAADGTVVFSDAGTPIGDAQPVVAGVATFATAGLAVGSHAVTATFVPADPAAFVGSVSAETAVSVAEKTAPEPVKASIEASVVGATEAGLQVSATVKNIVLRDAADVPDTGKADAGVYVGIIEKDRVAEYGKDAAAGAAQDFAYKMFIKDGAVTRDIPVPAAKLDRTKQYVAVTWLAHGMLNDSRYLGQVDLAVSDAQWDSVFGAPKASIEASVVGATEAGLQVSATVKNIVLRDAADVPDTGKADAGVYVGIIEKDRVAEYGKDAAAGAAQDFAYKMFIKDGAVTRDIPVPAAKLDRTKQYVAVTWLAHGMLNDSRYLGQVDLAVSDAQWDSVFPNAFTPDVRLFKADGVTPLDPAQEVNPGDEIVVRGTGFDPSSNVNFGRPPVTSGDPAGNYVVFGAFAQDWSPAGGVAGTQRVVADQRWAMTDETFVNIAPMYKPMVAGQRVQLTAAGTFEARLQAKDIPEGKTVPAGGSYGVFVYAAGTTSNASQEFGLRLNYKEERPTKPVYNPALSVFLADGTTKYTNQELKAGDKLVVRGTGFDPYANKPANSSGGVPIPNSLPQGTFVVFGSFAETWQPSKGASAATRTMNKDSRKWALAKDTLDAIPEAFRETIRKEWVQINPATGSFETEITLNAPDEALAKGTYGIYTYAGGAGQAVNASQELSVPVNFKTAGTVDPEPSITEGDLTWAFNTGWNAYVRGIANGTITASAGAKADAAGNTTYTQVKGGTYNAKTGTGSIHFAGTVRYVSEAHGFDIALRNPQITFTSKSAATLSIEVSQDDAAGVSAMKRIKIATITPGELVKSEDGRLNWAGAKGVFASNLQIDAWEQYANKATAPLSFSYGAEAEVPVGPTEPTKPVKPNPTPKPVPKPRPVDTAQQAGSLSWGISSGFRDYTTGRIAKGSISTSGVGASGGAYLFPQANGGSWDKQAQTGSVQYSGVVTFSGHKGLMTETFSNPVITVTSATSGTISAGGRSFALDLGSASKSVGANGAVTWSGVPVSGAISGGGSAGGGTGGGSFAVDPLTFTVGSASRVSYGATTQTDQKAARQAAATAPTTEGIRVITPADEIVPGGEIEFVAAGFEADERDILVVLYSDPIVLDEKAGASSVGEVRWIGTLPDDITPGEHTITLQGSKDAGAVIKVVKEKPKKKAPVVTQEEAAGDVTTQRIDAAAPVPADGPVWMWWVGAGALVALAVAMGVIVANQRRAAAAATVGSGTTPSA
ncbi:Ig-like domain-containing protein [Leucobacter komagatae]|uniref:Ig-like domain-containing protein n=1 Tax=Leucobacter komagatae TaxID=55969 RepID=A0A542Y6T1_9MICO|nr:HtaA domain-containing protein [Leucobacter komagatae]TQL43744.1 Ig-like domain-containing protein [Leucobacter komagatae]